MQCSAGYQHRSQMFSIIIFLALHVVSEITQSLSTGIEYYVHNQTRLEKLEPY